MIPTTRRKKTNNTSKTAIKDAQLTPDARLVDFSDNGIAFEGFARVFFQGQEDLYERQILPPKTDNSYSRTLNVDSHVYVTIDANGGTLNFYPYKQLYLDQATGDTIIQRRVPLIIDPPVELKYFVADLVPLSSCGVLMFVAGVDDSSTNNIEPRRHIFRLEFRNDAVLQRYERVSNFLLASSNLAQLSTSYGATNVAGAAKDYFSSHDDIEASRRLELHKVQESCTKYTTEIEGMSRDTKVLAKRFLRIVNERTILIPQPVVPPKTAAPEDDMQPQAAVNGDDDASLGLSSVDSIG